MGALFGDRWRLGCAAAPSCQACSLWPSPRALRLAPRRRRWHGQARQAAFRAEAVGSQTSVRCETARGHVTPSRGRRGPLGLHADAAWAKIQVPIRAEQGEQNGASGTGVVWLGQPGLAGCLTSLLAMSAARASLRPTVGPVWWRVAAVPRACWSQHSQQYLPSARES